MENSQPAPLNLGPDDFDVQYSDDEASLPPDEPSLPPGEWLRKNLFSSIGNSIATVLAGLFALWALRGLLNFIFSEERKWDAIRTNLRLLFTQAYPESQYVRIWVSVGILMVLAGLGVGAWARWGGVSMKRISTWLMSGGSFIALCVVLREPSALKAEDGEPVLDGDNQVVRESFADAMADRAIWWIIAVVLVGAGLAIVVMRVTHPIQADT